MCANLLSFEQGEAAVRYARGVVETKAKGEETPEEPEDRIFDDRRGVFVTLTKKGELRGCIGIVKPQFPLVRAIRSAASSAIRDPRFLPVKVEELDDITVEVTVLTKPEPVEVDEVEEYKDRIEIGKHGLIAKRGMAEGLLLPQVPVEQGWDTEEFLEGTCRKAGLHPKSWKEEKTEFESFEGQIFREEEPCGDVKERDIK